MMLIPLLLCLLLCGCAQDVPPEETTLPAQTVNADLLQQAASAMELRYSDLDAVPLTQRKVQGIRAMDEGLLVFSGYGSTTLTLLSGDDLTETASITLDFQLDPQDPSLQIGSGSLSYFDPAAKDVVVLNSALEETRRIALTEAFVGTPILSPDQNTLYYCTSTAIRGWDLDTGIHRCVKELSYGEQTLTGLHCGGRVLQCSVLDNGTRRTLFLSAETGQLVSDLAQDVALLTKGEQYYACLSDGSSQSLIFGQTDGDPRALLPEDLSASCTFLPEQNAAVTISSLSEESVQLDCYDLDTGTRRTLLTLDPLHAPTAIVSRGKDIFLLIYDPEYDCHLLCRWDMPDSLPAASLSYIDDYYTPESPDHAALAQCQAYAEEIGARHGIEVLIWKDAVAVQPWDYVFEMEYQPRIIREELELLDQRLSIYPEGFLAETASHFSGLKICLVRQITGSPASGSLNTATGIQFFEGNEAYLAIAAGEYSQQALYHELFHVMETHLLTNSTALDHWEDLNPSGFSYDYNYLTNASRDSGVYLSGEYRAFIDTYSMSYPKEDRARILEYAILPGNETLFQSDTMQAKLKALCQGIREAYGLKKSSETFRWEQYLKKSLAYQP